jgi:hypothetical protein
VAEAVSQPGAWAGLQVTLWEALEVELVLVATVLVAVVSLLAVLQEVEVVGEVAWP